MYNVNQVMSMVLILLSVLILVANLYSAEANMNQVFKPICIEAKIIPQEVKPGGKVSVTLKFRNEGNAAADAKYLVFLHLEAEKSCDAIVAQFDHFPSIPTTAWKPGHLTTDGPCVLDIPSDLKEGIYHLHVGVFAHETPGMPRFCDQYVGEIIVSKKASFSKYKPSAMSAEEVLRRRNALASHVTNPLTLENDKLVFAISMRDGAWFIKDKATGETWYSNPEEACLGEVELRKAIDRLCFLLIR